MGTGLAAHGERVHRDTALERVIVRAPAHDLEPTALVKPPGGTVELADLEKEMAHAESRRPSHRRIQQRRPDALPLAVWGDPERQELALVDDDPGERESHDGQIAGRARHQPERAGRPEHPADHVVRPRVVEAGLVDRRHVFDVARRDGFYGGRAHGRSRPPAGGLVASGARRYSGRTGGRSPAFRESHRSAAIPATSVALTKPSPTGPSNAMPHSSR